MKVLTIVLVLLFALKSTSQDLNIEVGVIEIAKVYNSNHGLKSLSDRTIFEKYQNTELENVANVIQELVQNKNRAIEHKFLSRPDSFTLKLFHTIIMVNYNMFEKEPQENHKVVQDYLKKDISIYELIQKYYGSLFTSVINKNRPFDYSNKNWDLNQLGLKDEKEKAIFFFVFMDKLGSQISLYMNAYNGPNWDGIERYAKLLPKVNGKYYYKFNNFDFEDFKMTIYKEFQLTKEYYLPRYYEILLGNILMMKYKNASQTQINNFISSSILSKKKYFEYCNNLDFLIQFLEDNEIKN